MNLTANEIINIIKECKGFVQSFSISENGTVSVVFNSTPIEAKNSTSPPPKQDDDKSESTTFLPFDESPIEAAEEELEQDMIEELKMRDPLKFEELIALGELTNVKDDSGSE